jgi:hypothetical protein
MQEVWRVDYLNKPKKDLIIHSVNLDIWAKAK